MHAAQEKSLLANENLVEEQEAVVSRLENLLSREKRAVDCSTFC